MPFDLPPSNPFLSPKPLDGNRLKLGALVGDEGERLMDDLLEGEDLVADNDDQAPGDDFMLSDYERAEEASSSEGETLENYFLLQEARELLGEQNVHGVKDVEFALGYSIDRSKVPPIPYTREDFLKSKEIKEKTGVEEMLILCVADRNGMPLTIQKMEEIFQPRYEEMELGRFLADKNLADNNWYQEESFYNDLGLTFGWKLITKQCIPDSVGKHHDWRGCEEYAVEESQEYAIQTYARNIDLPSALLCLYRPEPWEMLYAIGVHLLNAERRGRGAAERIMKETAHWSDRRSLDGSFVLVGYAGWEGMDIYRYPYEFFNDCLGVCLSRIPSLRV